MVALSGTIGTRGWNQAQDQDTEPNMEKYLPGHKLLIISVAYTLRKKGFIRVLYSTL